MSFRGILCGKSLVIHYHDATFLETIIAPTHEMQNVEISSGYSAFLNIKEDIKKIETD